MLRDATTQSDATITTTVKRSNDVHDKVIEAIKFYDRRVNSEIKMKLKTETFWNNQDEIEN